MNSTSCSLEYCHTNLFALQSLNDMKWKCFRRANHFRLETNSSGRIDNYKDPILIEYWNALNQDMLCAWRRVSTDDGQNIERELWLFGVNEDLPTNLPNLRSIDRANGSWNETAMSYDCRTILFKALHNMIEKHLLLKGFARLNKWFLLPVNDHSDVKIPNFSFNFNFFLHGDNKVCASVDVQCHKPIYHLTSKDLERTTSINVILAPYGISGTLIVPINRDLDTSQFRENWKKNYPIRQLDNLPEFVEVSTGNVRMYYPTCYVYKIDINDEIINSTKKTDLSLNRKKAKASSSTTRDNHEFVNLDARMHQNKFESSLIKTFANNLLINAQRNNTIDLDKKQDLKSADISSAITDPNNSQFCRCNQCIPSNTRSTPFVPFHRRSRPSTLPLIHTDASSSSSTTTTTQNEILIESTPSSSNIPSITNTQSNHPNEKANDWIANTPSSVTQQGPASVTNMLNSPLTNPPSNKGVKRSATTAFEETIMHDVIDDDEREQQRQTYDFYRTDSFLQLPLKRFRHDEQTNMITSTPEHVYQHGQPTPPSPTLTQSLPRTTLDFDESLNSPIHSTNPPLTPNTTMSNHQSSSSFYPTDGPSMSDLDTIIDSHESIDSIKSANLTLEQALKSPIKKENLSLPPPPTTMPTVSIYSLNKSLNGVFHHEVEQIYNTPPGSSSSEKLQSLHSPYAIIAETAGHIANTFDTLNQFNQESIIIPFESTNINERSSYNPIPKLNSKKAEKHYDPSKSILSLQTIQFSLRSQIIRTSKQSLPMNDYSSSPFNVQQHIRQLPTPRSMPTPHQSPMRLNDIHSSPSLNHRSVGSVQTLNSPTISMHSEIDSLVLNVLLNDSILNMYRDINFDSCVLCACTPNELSIHGADSIIYLEKSKNSHSSTIYDHQQTSINNSCSCGFSAVVNLRLSSSTGLFYEDETEITGIKNDIKYRQIQEQLTVQLLEFIERKESSISPFDYLNSNRFIRSSPPSPPQQQQQTKKPFHQYENLACRLAIEQARNFGMNSLADDVDKYSWLHQWSYSTFPLDSDQQLITMLRALQPILVEALKKRHVNGLWSTIDGPLTWKSFHQLLYIQNQHAHLEEQISGPQPIPYVLTGFDREWMTLAPYGLKFWDKLCLEPYSKHKEISYICVVPDNDYVCSTSKIYLRDLSTNYELCRLGTHRPLTKLFADQGLVRLSTKNLDRTQLPNTDPWFNDNENQHPLGTRLKLYAQVLKDKLSMLLSVQSFESILLDDQTSRRDHSRSFTDSSSLDLHSNSTNDSFNNTSAPSPSTPSSSSLSASNIYTTGSATTDALNMSTTNLTNSNNQQIDSSDLHAYESFYHGSLKEDQLFLVIYLIDTFRYELMSSSTNEKENIDTEIYVKKAIYRIYMDLVKDLPEKIASRINIQIIPFESILNQQIESDSELRLTQYKRLSFHIYDQLRRTVSYTTRAKSLTGFGPAASEEKTPAKLVMQLYTPAYILSPKSDFRFKSFADITEQTNQNGSVLFCSYCLSDDQRYLLASCSDDRGELSETCSINIEIPDRFKRKTQYARKVALQKLWDFIMRIVTSTTMPWRIVIGRLGRLGHGELKYWGIILSKKNLVRCATLIRESCPMCHILRSHDHPVILSACLISMETHHLLSILPESIEFGEIRGTQPSNNNNSNMQTNGQILNDLSVTHILTLPTSASVQHLQAVPRANDPRQLSNETDDDFFGSFFGAFDADIDNMQSPPPDLELPNTYGLDFNASGSLSRLNSLSVSQTNFNGNALNSSHTKAQSSQYLVSEVDLNETPILHEQPLALGFYVSTIGTLNPLPDWMLQEKIIQRVNNSSSVFKATLHISVPNAQLSDEMLLAQNHDQKSIHPLDSNFTYVVLRNVLESYHRLSWLLIDGKTNERASCLPIHMETLLRLYHAFRKFV